MGWIVTLYCTQHPRYKYANVSTNGEIFGIGIEKGFWFQGRKAWKIDHDKEGLRKLQRVNLGGLLSQCSEGQKETFLPPRT